MKTVYGEREEYWAFRCPECKFENRYHNSECPAGETQCEECLSEFKMKDPRYKSMFNTPFEVGQMVHYRSRENPDGPPIGTARIKAIGVLARSDGKPVLWLEGVKGVWYPDVCELAE